MAVVHHRYLIFAGAASVALAAIGFAAVLLAFRDAGNLLVVHFEAGRGIDYFGTRADVFAIAAAGAGLVLLNLALAYSLARRIPLAGHFVAYGNVLFALLLLLGMAGIVAVN